MDLPEMLNKEAKVALADRIPPTLEEYKAFRQRFCNWGRWGKEDQLGTLNFITEETRRRAIALVREGRTISCANPLATTPGLRNPRPSHHFIEVFPTDPPVTQDYIGFFVHGFVDTHIDSLGHVFSSDGKATYNGRSSSEVTTRSPGTCSVQHFRDGIMTRGVLYDIPRLRGVNYVTVDAPVQGWELEDAAKAQGVEPQPGDVVLVHFGRETYFNANPDAPNRSGQKPGLHPSVLEFLYEHDIALLGSEFDEAPDQGYQTPFPIHAIANPYMGLPTLWNTNFERLTQKCGGVERWEFLFVIAPLVVGATGSVVNPIAVF